MSIEPNNPDFAVETNRILNRAPFVTALGILPVHFEPGSCETQLTVETKHLQQDGYVHMAVQAAIADHTAGAAAATLIARDKIILSVEFNLSLLRAAKGSRLECIATVLKPGRRLIVVESEVYCQQKNGNRDLVSKATVTLAVVDRPPAENDIR